MIARLLNLCGLDLGAKEQLMGANANNAMGHFEHTGFLEINNALLKCLGGSWDNPPLLNRDWEADPALRDLADQAETLISTFSGSRCWGWKEPRTTLLLPFWQRLLPNLRCIICVRSPLEVARSLAERDGLSIPAGAHLWYQYTRAAMMHTEDHPRILSFYEDYFCAPLAELNRVGKFVGLETIDNESRLQQVISRELRHQLSNARELLDEASIPFECKFLYLGLRALKFEEALAIRGACTETKTMDDIGCLLPLIDNLHGRERTLQLEAAVCEKEQQLATLAAKIREQLKEKEDEILQLRQRNAHLQIFADAVRETLAYRFYKRFLRPFRRKKIAGDSSARSLV